MKTQKNINTYKLFLLFFIAMWGNLVFAQQSSIQLPQFFNEYQTTKQLTRIGAHNSTYSLTRQSNGTLNYQLTSATNEEQLWWIIQDDDKKAFAIASATDPNTWLVMKQSPDRIELEKKDSLLVSGSFGNEQSDAYFFTFEMQENSSSRLIRSEKYPTKYLKTNNRSSSVSTWTLTTQILPVSSASRDEFYFTFTFTTLGNNVYSGIPVFDSNHHIETLTANKTTISANGIISGNNRILCSGRGVCINEEGNEEMFSLTFNTGVTKAKVGLLHYQDAIFDQSVYQGGGLRNPEAGIGKRGGTIYLFNKSRELKTNFSSGGTPIYFGYKKGVLYAKQNDTTVTMGGVNTETLLNSSFGNVSRLMVMLENSSIEIAAKSNIIFFTSNHSGYSTTSVHSTNPSLSYSMSTSKPANKFDWRTETYDLRYKANGQIITEVVQSPFYSNGTDFTAIAAKYDPLSNYIGGEDYDYYEGWELITKDFGYNADGTLKPSHKLRGEPYLILYNRFTGKLRVFIYITNPSIANQLEIRISDGPHSGVITKYQPARLWGSILQGRALDDLSLANSPYSKSVELTSSTTGKFIFADFILNHDPCIAEFESNLRISVRKITSGTLQIVGRNLGGKIPVNSPSIGDWLSESNNYLTGVLNTPYGKLSNTMGDITFRNFDRWGKQDWSNEASFVLPGKKVQDWEKEVAKLKWQGEGTMSAGDLMSGTGKLMKGAAKIAQVAKPPFVNPGKALEGAGELVDAAGTLLKGSGRSLKARAAKIYYDNLKDQPDKTIDVSLPNPQPSVVFSELAAQGTLQIQTTVFNDVVITTPGSKNSQFAPVNEYLNGSKGLFPFYNEGLGLFNLLYKPEVAVALVKRKDKIGGFLKLKNRPYLSTNVHKSIGYSGGFFVAYYVVTTYDNNGNATDSKRSTPYLFSKHPSQTYQVLPSSLDITNLIDEQTIISNVSSSPSNSNFSSWIQVEVEVEYYGFGLKSGNGRYSGVSASQSYLCNTSFNYHSSSDFSNSINAIAKNRANNVLPTYNGSDIALWGSNYIIYDGLPNYQSSLTTYCNNTKSLSSELDSISEFEEELREKTSFLRIDDIKVYPNPSSGNFKIKYKAKGEGEVLISVLSGEGKKILAHNDLAQVGESKQIDVNIESAPDGTYFLRIEFENGKKYFEKLLKVQ